MTALPSTEEQLADYIYSIQNWTDAKEVAAHLWPALAPRSAVQSAQPVAWRVKFDAKDTWTLYYSDPLSLDEDRPEIIEPLYNAPAQALRGCDDIAAERQRQISKEGWTPEHDDEHSDGAMASAALCYVYASIFDPGDFPLRYWPWDKEWWKPADARRNLVRAGALIAAEIDRLDRASPLPSADCGGGK